MEPDKIQQWIEGNGKAVYCITIAIAAEVIHWSLVVLVRLAEKFVDGITHLINLM